MFANTRGAQGAPPPPSTGTMTDGQGSWASVETAAQRPYRPTHGVRRAPSDTVFTAGCGRPRGGVETKRVAGICTAQQPLGRWSTSRNHTPKPRPRWDVRLPAGQPGEETAGPFLHCGPASQAQVPRRLLPHPSPDGLIRVEVRTVARQIHQPQPQPRRPQVLLHRLATVRRGIAPDHVQWTKAPLPSLHQQGLEVVPAALPPLLGVLSQPRAGAKKA